MILIYSALRYPFYGTIDIIQLIRKLTSSSSSSSSVDRDKSGMRDGWDEAQVLIDTPSRPSFRVCTLNRLTELKIRYTLITIVRLVERQSPICGSCASLSFANQVWGLINSPQKRIIIRSAGGREEDERRVRSRNSCRGGRKKSAGLREHGVNAAATRPSNHSLMTNLSAFAELREKRKI